MLPRLTIALKVYPWIFAVIPAFLAAYYLGFTVGAPNKDIFLSLEFWFQRLESEGLSGISGEYSTYTPPYLYLLWFASLFGDWAPNIVLIKLTNLPFIILSSVLVAAIVAKLGRPSRVASAAGILFLGLPTVVINSVWWAQCDIIYTSILLLFFYYTLSERSLPALIAFGIAISIKLQAVFLGPYVLLLMLRGTIKWKHAVLVPVIYCLMMTPAWLAGRPWLELLQVYLRQADTYHRLSMNAPNLYLFVDNGFYETGVRLGFVIATLVAAALMVFGRRLIASAEGKLLVATACAILMPFVLPKMHDRYFFVADVFTFIAAFSLRGGWPLAILMQLGSLFAYTKFLWNFSAGPRIGAVFIVAAVIWLAYIMRSFWLESRRLPLPQAAS